MSRIRKVVVVILTLVLTAGLLNGCTLAIPDEETARSGDRLIGAFVTEEYLDLFDMEAYLNDNISSVSGNREIEVSDTAGYEQKLYATVDKHDSDNVYDWEYSFDGLEGIQFFAPYVEDANGGYWSSVSEPAISELNTNVTSTDEGEEHEISGTIYFPAESAGQDKTYYMNPVFQCEDGRIYVMAGEGMSTSGEAGEGMKCTMTLDNMTEETVNGETKTNKSRVELSYETMNEPTQVTVLQMGSENQILKSDSYEPENMPETLTTEQGAQYLIVAIDKVSVSGDISTQHTIYDHTEEETIIETYHALDGKVYIRQDTAVTWR